MKTLSGKAFAAVLERQGWQLLRVNGSHHIYGKAEQAARLSVPIHANTPLKAGLQRHLMRVAGLSDDDL